MVDVSRAQIKRDSVINNIKTPEMYFSILFQSNTWYVSFIFVCVCVYLARSLLFSKPYIEKIQFGIAFRSGIRSVDQQ